MKEDMYSNAYNSRISDRVENFNATQLRGIHSHVSQASSRSMWALWRNANAEIVAQVHEKMKIRTAEHDKKLKAREDEKIHIAQKMLKKEAKKKESIRVLNNIIKATYEKARLEIKDEEQLRQVFVFLYS